MMRRSRLIRILALGTLLSVLAACSAKTTENPNNSSQQKPVVKELRIAFDQGLSNFDPHVGTDNSELQTIYAVFDSLIRFDSKLNFVPGLAESWEFPDPKTLVFKLRKGVKFHDGTDFNAEAVKFNIERIKDPKNASVVRNDLAPIQSVDVVDSNTVRLNLSAPSAALLASFADRAGAMVSPTALQKMGPKDFARKPVGAGPFIFKDWVDGSHWVLEKNPDFWEKGYPKLDKITFNHFRTSEPAIQALKSGEIDFYERLPQAQVDWVQKSADFSLINVDSIRLLMLYVNRSVPPLNNKALRLAVAHSLDRDAIAQTVGGPGIKGAAALFPPGYWANDPTVKGFDYNPDKVKQYLAEAKATGWDGSKVVIFGNTSGEHALNSQLVSQMLTKAGVPNELVMGDTARSNEEFWKQSKQALSVSAWGGRLDPGVTSNELFSSTGSYNPPRITTPHGGSEALDNLLKQAAQSYDAKERAKLYGQIQQEAIKEALLIPLYFSPYQAAVRKTITGFEPNAFGKVIYRVMDFK